jgi:hypothetical protein
MMTNTRTPPKKTEANTCAREGKAVSVSYKAPDMLLI